MVMKSTQRARWARLIACALTLVLFVAVIPVPAAQATPAVPMMADEFELAYYIVQNLEQGETTTLFRFSGGDPDYYLIIDYVRLIWPYQVTVYFTPYRNDDRVMDVTIVRDQERYQSRQEGMAEAVVEEIITTEMTDREKVKVIHDWIVLQNTYNHNVSYSRSRGSSVLPFTAYAVFANGNAVCAGYADAFTLMARSAGLLALDVNGYANEERTDNYGHAWNMVLVEGTWLYLDCTWDDPDDGQKISYDYFLISEEEMAEDHYWDIAELNKFREYVLPQRPDYAEALRQMNLFKGMADGDARLDFVPDRAQAAVMLVRLLGSEDEALSTTWIHPFTDKVPTWATDHVGWLYAKKLTMGTSADKYAPTRKVTLNQYLTFLLRSMDYVDGVDFQYEKASDFALELGVVTQDQIDALRVRPFIRADMVNLSYAALGCYCRGGEETLLERLTAQGVVGDRAEELDPAA